MKQSHSLLQKSVRQALHLAGWFTVPIKAGLGTYKGLADLYAIRNGRQIWIEIKCGNDKLSPHQIRFACDIQRQKGEYGIVRNFEDLKRFGMIENLLL